MATSTDEFDPPLEVLRAVVREVLALTLETLVTETSIPYRAKVAVWVRDCEYPKFFLSRDGFGDYDEDENILARIRFRHTYREDRVLFSIETQHANWRKTGLSGVRCRGDIHVDGTKVSPRLRSRTICHDSGWQGW